MAAESRARATERTDSAADLYASPEIRARQSQKVLWIGFALNVIVAVFKFGFGTFSGSMAMTNDGVASFLDAGSTLIGLAGVAIASRPPSKTHPYGHAKYETYASVAIGIILIVAAGDIAREAIASLMGGGEHIYVDWASYAIMVGTMALNVFVAWWEGKWGRLLFSEALTADAQHTWTDVYVSISVICSLIFVQMGYPVADALVSLIVAFAVLWSAISIFRQANRTLADVSRLEASEVEDLVVPVEGVRAASKVRSRGSEGEVYVDLHLILDPDLSLVDAHDVATRAERLIEESFPGVADVIVRAVPDEAAERAGDTGRSS